jgi:hemoglobin
MLAGSKTTKMNDIQSKEDVTFLVDKFYEAVLTNETLSPFFKHLNFEKHLPKMIHFWSFVLLDEPGYTTNVTEKHEKMPLSMDLFNLWVNLFKQTVDELFEGEKAELAKQRAVVLGWTMGSKH